MASRKIEDCEEILQRCWRDASHTFAYFHASDPQPFITCTYRSNAEQLKLYAKGRTEPGPVVTQIRQNGKHNLKPAKAFDIAFKKKDGTLDWSPALFKKFAAIVALQYPEVQWGGNWRTFKDLPHFQV